MKSPLQFWSLWQNFRLYDQLPSKQYNVEASTLNRNTWMLRKSNLDIVYNNEHKKTVLSAPFMHIVWYNFKQPIIIDHSSKGTYFVTFNLICNWARNQIWVNFFWHIFSCFGLHFLTFRQDLPPLIKTRYVRVTTCECSLYF